MVTATILTGVVEPAVAEEPAPAPYSQARDAAASQAKALNGATYIGSILEGVCRHATSPGESTMRTPPQGKGMPLQSGPLLGDPKERFEVRVTADSHFAWLRTRLAVERTLMSWVRTAVSLIGFGFAIVQFFGRTQQMPGLNPERFPEAPRYVGLALIFCGNVALVISVWEYRWSLRYLWGGSFTPIAGVTKEGMQTPLVAVAVLLMFVGLFAFFAVLWRFV